MPRAKDASQKEASGVKGMSLHRFGHESAMCLQEVTRNNMCESSSSRLRAEVCGDRCDIHIIRTTPPNVGSQRDESTETSHEIRGCSCYCQQFGRCRMSYQPQVSQSRKYHNVSTVAETEGPQGTVLQSLYGSFDAQCMIWRQQSSHIGGHRLMEL